MPEVLEVSGGVPVHVWTDPAAIEPAARGQLSNMARLPWVFPHVAVMPDVHFGIGATVGSVVPMRGAVAPAAVGVDIGCGVAAVRTNLSAADLPDSLAALRSQVESVIPLAHNGHTRLTSYAESLDLFSEFSQLHAKVQDQRHKAMSQMGSLGGGNHFVELCLDEQDRVWLLLHSGSRNIGKLLAEVHISSARSLEHNRGLADRDLAVFLAGTAEMDAYRRDLFWAQRYAAANREGMLRAYESVIRALLPQARFLDRINCHHNYVSEEEHFGEQVLVTRKGAISARTGELGVIPGSMGTRSFVVEGLGNPDAFCSASHGAGRRMSRSAARKAFSAADLAEQTLGIECRKDSGVVDEIPAAYKDIDEVMANQADLVSVRHELRQLMCVKG